MRNDFVFVVRWLRDAQARKRFLIDLLAIFW
jgi:hypothetical protein